MNHRCPCHIHSGHPASHKQAVQATRERGGAQRKLATKGPQQLLAQHRTQKNLRLTVKAEVAREALSTQQDIHHTAVALVLKELV